MVAATTSAAVLTTAAATLAWRSATRGFVVAVAYAVLTLCCGALALNRYDPVVALVVAAALLLLAVRRWLPAAITLGLGFALKLTPALLLPLVLLLQERRRAVLVLIAGFALAAALPFVPFVVNDPGTAATPFTYHARRPLQLESVLGTPWVAATLVGAAHPRIVSGYGSRNFASTATDFVATASPWLLVLSVAAIYAVLWRKRHVLRASPRTRACGRARRAAGGRLHEQGPLSPVPDLDFPARRAVRRAAPPAAAPRRRSGRCGHCPHPGRVPRALLEPGRPE